MLTINHSVRSYVFQLIYYAIELGNARLYAQVQAHAQAQLNRQLQLQELAQIQQAQAQQQQAILMQNLSVNQRQPGTGQQQIRNALAMLELQQTQFIDPQLQAQLFVQAQAQRALLAAHVQGQVDPRQQQCLQQLHLQQMAQLHQSQQPTQLNQRRTPSAHSRMLTQPTSMTYNDIPLHVRSATASTLYDPYKTPQLNTNPVFESVITPSSEKGRSPIPTPKADTPANQSSRPPAGRFAQARQSQPAGQKPTESLSAFLSRRRAIEEPSRTSEATLTTVETPLDQERANTAQTLGIGRPANTNASSRAASTPTSNTARVDPTPRAASYAGQSLVRAIAIRQPLGPPGGAQELKEKNFQTLSVPNSMIPGIRLMTSSLRKQAGLKLGILNRRTDRKSCHHSCSGLASALWATKRTIRKRDLPASYPIM